MKKATMRWQTLRQLKGKSVWGYTQEFRKRDLILGISLDSPETLLKYISGLHSYIRHTIIMFNPTSVDDVSIQATHLEARGKNVNPEVGGSSKPTARKNKEKRMSGSDRGYRFRKDLEENRSSKRLRECEETTWEEGEKTVAHCFLSTNQPPNQHLTFKNWRL